MVPSILAVSKKIALKVLGNLNGLLDTFMKDTGKNLRWTAKENSDMPMGD